MPKIPTHKVTLTMRFDAALTTLDLIENAIASMIRVDREDVAEHSRLVEARMSIMRVTQPVATRDPVPTRRAPRNV